jgi:hypothetical protein
VLAIPFLGRCVGGVRFWTYQFIVKEFVALLRWFFACPSQNLSCFLYICTGSSLKKEL